MNNRQEAKLTMYNTVISFCDQQVAIVKSVPALQAAYLSFKGAATNAVAFSRNFEASLTGLTQDKRKLREHLARLASGIALNIYAHADETGNGPLKSITNRSYSDLLKLSELNLFNTCSDIADAAKENSVALAAYNITGESLTEFNGLLARFQAAVPGPRNITSDASTKRKTLSSFIKAADFVLKGRMDKIIKSMLITNNAFYESYFSNRVIIAPQSTATQIKGIVTAKGKKELLSGVSITVVGADTTVTTDENGKYLVKPMAFGPCSIQATHTGYHPLTVTNITVKLGQVRKLNLILIPVNE